MTLQQAPRKRTGRTQRRPTRRRAWTLRSSSSRSDSRVSLSRSFGTSPHLVQPADSYVSFYRLPEIELPQPLWVSSDRVVLSQIPLCSLCGGTREIEFQVLSTLLTHLGDESLSFDSLLLYTCRTSCAIPARESKTGWTEEVLVVQSFEAGGVKFGRA